MCATWCVPIVIKVHADADSVFVSFVLQMTTAAMNNFFRGLFFCFLPRGTKEVVGMNGRMKEINQFWGLRNLIQKKMRRET